MHRPLTTLLLLAFLTFFLGLGRMAVTDADEAFYAEAAREMLERGDWLTPHYNYEYRWQKPVLYYWLTAATYLAVGATEWAARAWSALSGLGLVFLAWAACRRLTGREDTAWLAGAVVATCFGCFALARMALPDLPLTFFITASIWAALRAAGAVPLAAGPGRSGPPWDPMRWWAMAGLAAGLGFLMKGPVALVIPAVVLIPVWWRRRAVTVVGPKGVVLAALVFGAVAMPWYVAMWLEHGAAYLESFFLGDNLERFATDRFNEPRAFWFYLPVVVGGLLPWSPFLLVLPARSVLAVLRGRRRLSEEEWLLLLWALMPLLFYTMSVGKQPRYVLPALVPLAMVLARSVTRHMDAAAAGDRHAVELRVATWAAAAVFALAAVFLSRAEPILITAYPWATWMSVGALGALAVAVGHVAFTHHWRRLPGVLASSAAVLLIAVQFGALAGRRPEAVEEMAALVRNQREATERIGAYRVFVRNLVFYTGESQTDLFDEGAAVAFVQSPDRVLLVASAVHVDRLEALSGIRLRRLGQVRYLDTAGIRLGTLLAPDPARDIDTVVLLTNR